jgi:hypothetical protein
MKGSKAYVVIFLLFRRTLFSIALSSKDFVPLRAISCVPLDNRDLTPTQPHTHASRCFVWTCALHDLEVHEGVREQFALQRDGAAVQA